jgi:hypothetical protein
MPLTKKHRDALQLIKQNKYSLKEIAQKSGISYNYLRKLTIGDPTTGNVGKLFSIEVDKIDKDIENRTNRLMIRTRELAYKKLKAWVKAQKDCDSKIKHKQMVDVVNALNKAYPQVKIESYTWKEGISSEEALNEFRRLAGVANKSALRDRVSEALVGRPEQVPVSPGQADAFGEDAQDTVLPAEPEAGEVSSEPGSGESDIRGE